MKPNVSHDDASNWILPFHEPDLGDGKGPPNLSRRSSVVILREQIDETQMNPLMVSPQDPLLQNARLQCRGLANLQIRRRLTIDLKSAAAACTS